MRFKKYLPPVIAAAVLICLFSVLFSKLFTSKRELEHALAVNPVGSYSTRIPDFMNLMLGQDGVYYCSSATGQGMPETGIVHMGWFTTWHTIDDRIIRFDDTSGVVRIGIYVNETLYLVEPEEAYVTVFTKVSDAPGYSSEIREALPSPRT